MNIPLRDIQNPKFEAIRNQIFYKLLQINIPEKELMNSAFRDPNFLAKLFGQVAIAIASANTREEGADANGYLITLTQVLLSEAVINNEQSLALLALYSYIPNFVIEIAIVVGIEDPAEIIKTAQGAIFHLYLSKTSFEKKLLRNKYPEAYKNFRYHTAPEILRRNRIGEEHLPNPEHYFTNTHVIDSLRNASWLNADYIAKNHETVHPVYNRTKGDYEDWRIREFFDERDFAIEMSTYEAVIEYLEKLRIYGQLSFQIQSILINLGYAIVRSDGKTEIQDNEIMKLLARLAKLADEVNLGPYIAERNIMIRQQKGKDFKFSDDPIQVCGIFFDPLDPINAQGFIDCLVAPQEIRDDISSILNSWGESYPQGGFYRKAFVELMQLGVKKYLEIKGLI